MSSDIQLISVSTSGMGFLSFLGLLFIALKLCHVIEWSWLWVTLPLWGGIAIWAGIVAIGGLLLLIAWLANR
jgi:hypothetical protein